MTTSVIIGTLHSVPNYCRKTLDYVLCWVSLEQENGSACRSQGALLCAGSHLLCGRAWEQWSAGGGVVPKGRAGVQLFLLWEGDPPSACLQLHDHSFPLSASHFFFLFENPQAPSHLCVFCPRSLLTFMLFTRHWKLYFATQNPFVKPSSSLVNTC